MKLDANVTILYPHLDLPQALAAAAADGFTAVECRTPYDHPPEMLAERLAELGLTCVQFNLPAGDWAAGERGNACLPGREAEVREGIETAIRYARIMGCPQLNCLAGLAPAGVDRAVLIETLAANLRHAAARLADAGIRLQLEAVNDRDNPGALIATTAAFEEVHARTGADNLYLQYDFFHMQVMQGDLMRTFARLQPLINHVQIADNPGRHEPGSGEINYGFIFSELRRLGYDRWIGCEYVPAGGVAEGLARWLPMAGYDRPA